MKKFVKHQLHVSWLTSLAESLLMKRAVLLVAVIFLLGASARGDFLGVGWDSTNSPVVRINETTGASVSVGLSGFSHLNSLAINSVGNIFATSPNTLITINPSTGEGTTIALLNADIRGLTFASGDVLYGIRDVGESKSDDLVTINASSGAVSLVSTTSLPGLQSLEFSLEGTLYSWDIGSGYLSSGHGLVTINPITGAATPVSPSIGTINIQTLSFGSNGILYGAGTNKLYTINTNTGEATLVGTGGLFDIRGMVCLNSVPEPSTLALLGMVALGLLAYACRQRKALAVRGLLQGMKMFT
jgi:hypothetical protein